MRRTFATHPRIIVRTVAAIFAEIMTRIRLALFAPVATIALTNRSDQLDATQSVAVAVAIADGVLTAGARVARSAIATRRQRCRNVPLADTAVLTLQIQTVLAIRARIAGRTLATFDNGAIDDGTSGRIVTALAAIGHRYLAAFARPLRLAATAQRWLLAAVGLWRC